MKHLSKSQLEKLKKDLDEGVLLNYQNRLIINQRREERKERKRLIRSNPFIKFLNIILG